MIVVLAVVIGGLYAASLYLRFPTKISLNALAHAARAGVSVTSYPSCLSRLT